MASRLTAHPGLELFAKFSPDGKQIAFTGQYDGDEQVYVVAAAGGEPKQLTYYPARAPCPTDGASIIRSMAGLPTASRSCSARCARAGRCPTPGCTRFRPMEDSPRPCRCRSPAAGRFPRR